VMDSRSPLSSPMKTASEEFSGVGMMIQNQAPYIVVQITPGGPADRSGKVAIGDVLLRVNGKEIGHKPITDVWNLILGPPGTGLTMELSRKTETGEQYIFLTVERQKRNSPSEAVACPPPVAPSMSNSGEKVGLGFTFTRDASGRHWVVRRLKEGGFAEVSGQIFPGDVLMKVGGKSLAQIFEAEEVANLIAGPEGSTVSLDLRSPHTFQVKQVTGIRGRQHPSGGPSRTYV